MIVLYLVLALAGILLVVGIIWRIAHGHHPIPCPVWLSWLVEMDNPFTRTNRAAVILEHLDLRPGMQVLDAGCGPGRISIPAARAVGPQGEVVALDLQAGMLKRAQARAQAANVSNIRFVQAGLGTGKLGNNIFDRALLVTVLGEVANREEALREIFTALRPGGILSVTEIIFDPHYTRRAKVTQLATSVGFRERNFFGNRVAYTLHLEKPQ